MLAILDREERDESLMDPTDTGPLTDAVRRARAEAAATGADPSTVLVRVG